MNRIVAEDDDVSLKFYLFLCTGHVSRGRRHRPRINLALFAVGPTGCISRDNSQTGLGTHTVKATADSEIKWPFKAFARLVRCRRRQAQWKWLNAMLIRRIFSGFNRCYDLSELIIQSVNVLRRFFPRVTFPFSTLGDVCAYCKCTHLWPYFC